MAATPQATAPGVALSMDDGAEAFLGRVEEVRQSLEGLFGDRRPVNFTGTASSEIGATGTSFGMQLAAKLRIEEDRRAKCEAFAMGQQERLGAESWLQGLHSDVVRMVLEQV